MPVAGNSEPESARSAGIESLSGKRKAAALLVALGLELSSQVLKHLRESEIDAITAEIVRLERMPAHVREAILQQCYEEAVLHQQAMSGGMEFARDILSRALGPQKANEIINRIGMAQVPSNAPFDFIRHTDPAQLLAVLESEHPQTIALVLSHLSPDVAGRIMAGLDASLQADVAQRIALMEGAAPEVAQGVESVLKRKLAAFTTDNLRAAGGVDYLVKVLNVLDARTERAILEGIENSDPELAADIKQRMFVFEDIVLLDDRSIQRLLRDVNPKDLALALRGSSDEVKARIFKNMSSRAQAMLKDDMDSLGPIRLRLVEEAQQRIVNIIRALQDAEEIYISRGAEDVLI